MRGLSAILLASALGLAINPAVALARPAGHRPHAGVLHHVAGPRSASAHRDKRRHGRHAAHRAPVRQRNSADHRSAIKPHFLPLCAGVGLWQAHLNTAAGPVCLHALRIDLRLADVAPVAAVGHHRVYGIERTSVMARRSGAIAGINGSFFSPRSRQPMDVLMVGGKLLSRPVRRPALVLKADGTASIAPDRNVYRTYAISAVGGGPTLLSKGRVTMFGRPNGVGGREPRTAVGLCADRKVILLAIDGRSRVSVGATLSEEAHYLFALGARDAINLDGGGSSTMVVFGHVINRPSDGFERPVSNALMVFPRGKGMRAYANCGFRYSGYDLAGS